MAHTFILVFLSLCSFGVLYENVISTEPSSFRLVGGVSRCQGKLELQTSALNWTGVEPYNFNLQFANRVCAQLECGSAVSVHLKPGSSTEVTRHLPDCEELSLSQCFRSDTISSEHSLELHCSESVRLVSGPSLCSGSLQIHWDQAWTWVCEGALDLQDAEVVCRELGCGAPSFLQGARSREGQVLLGQVFHCDGHESALMDCPSSSSGTCSSGTAVSLTCSEPDHVKLLENRSRRCKGVSVVGHLGEWRGLSMSEWNLETAASLCHHFDCGSMTSFEVLPATFPSWPLSSSCVLSTSSLRECVTPYVLQADHIYPLTCSESVRLVSGPSLCSGSLQIHWDQAWTWVCEGALDLQDAEVVCRELGCGAPSLLQGAHSGDSQILLAQLFHCDGHESALMDCPSSSSGTCSSGTAVSLTCSEPIRLVGSSRCAGVLEVRFKGEWRPVFISEPWDLLQTVCRDLHCGPAVHTVQRQTDFQNTWEISPDCVKEAPISECIRRGIDTFTNIVQKVVCSEMARPTIALSVSADGALEAHAQGVRVLLGSNFTVICSIEPAWMSSETKYQGSVFQLISTNAEPIQNLTQPAVDHSAHFLFSDAGPSHRGGYACVYHLHVFNYTFSSQSVTLQISPGAPDSQLIIRVLLILLLKLIYIPALYYYCKVLYPHFSPLGSK